MGDRANILVKEDKNDNGVCLYSHWSGSDLPRLLQVALQKKQRWDDCQYLTRIIFDTMTAGHQGEETGYGISAYVGDGDDRILVVNCKNKSVSTGNGFWTFEQYIKLSDNDIDSVFSY